MPMHLSLILGRSGYKNLSQRHYASSSTRLRNPNSTNYSKTVFIPRSEFSPKHDPKTELSIQEDPRFAQAYLDQDPARKPYIIHDGPPFANGQIHLGHAINKILKDIAARYAMITGHRVEFITGWDVHGLPIELQVFKMLDELQRQGIYGGGLLLDSSASPEQFRAKARAYAKTQIDMQMASFKRIGLLTDWNKRYTTDDPSYVANQLRAFSQLVEQKLVFKDFMPVNWSLKNKTTLAEADIEYRSDHISKSAYLMYEIIDPPFATDVPGQPVYALVWTTTPWSLLDNRAIAFNNQETFCIVKAMKDSPGDTKYLLASLDTLQKVIQLLDRLGYRHDVKTHLPGTSLVGLKYKPLLNDVTENNENNSGEPLPFLGADFVDGSKGTGLVHIAPNYGPDDFQLIKKSQKPFKVGLVDSGGRFVEAAGQQLAGKHIFSDGNQTILNLLDQHQALLLMEQTQHSYPYETRTGEPIMIRASPQIFVDTSRVIPRCLKALESASFFPEHRRTQFINTLISSPAWCISRQRLWGTPIPVFYSADDIHQEKMISHPLIIEHLCKTLYRRRFMDYWWTMKNDELIPQDLLDKCKIPHKSENLVRGTDIFDVWSDSGLSWQTTTNGLNDSKSQVDLYLEGVDQIRGWFLSSSIMSMILRGCLPTKRFYLHGFALDKDGRKMSKSQGNVVDPIELFTTHGVDPVRWWAARAAGDNSNVAVDAKEFASSVSQSIKKIRLILRYLIGTLANHDPIVGAFDHTKLQLFDQYYLDKLYRFASNVDHHYKNYRYNDVARTIIQFLEDDFSPVYLQSIKDHIYCDEINSERRKSTLTVLNLTYNSLLRCLYPLTPHLVHEACEFIKPAEPANEWSDLGYKASWKNDVLHNQFETIVTLKKMFNTIVPSQGNDSCRDSDSVLFVKDKKLYKSLSKITNATPDLMSELFKTSTFILGYKEQIEIPNDAHIVKSDEDNFKIDCHTGARTAEPPVKVEAGSAVKEDEQIHIQLLSWWMWESPDESRRGGCISINGAEPTPVELHHRRSSKRKCLRCRRYNVLSLEDHANICDRCKDALDKLETLD